jgi:hypothetical protein
MIRCNHCGTNNLDGSEYCDECGTKLAVAAQSPRQAYTPPPAQFITQVAPPPPPSFTKDSVTPKPATPYTPPPPPPPAHPLQGHSLPAHSAEGAPDRDSNLVTGQSRDHAIDRAQAPAPNRAAPPATIASSPPASETSANIPQGDAQAMNQTTAFNGQTSALRGGEGAKQQAMSDEKNQPAGAKLIIQRGGKVGKEFPISGTESMIGRWDADGGIFPDIDLDQDDPEAKVSRRHARIQFLNNQYLIEDLGSTNGTFINRGPRLLPGAKQPLNNGDEIIVGKTFLKFVLS